MWWRVTVIEYLDIVTLDADPSWQPGFLFIILLLETWSIDGFKEKEEVMSLVDGGGWCLRYSRLQFVRYCIAYALLVGSITISAVVALRKD